MRAVRLDDVSFGANVRILNEVDTDEARRIAISDMRTAFAHRLLEAKVEITKGQFHTDYRMQIYVFTPEEFMKVVNEKAEELVNAREYWNKK